MLDGPQPQKHTPFAVTGVTSAIRNAGELQAQKCMNSCMEADTIMVMEVGHIPQG